MEVDYIISIDILQRTSTIIHHQGPTMTYNQVDRNPAKKKATALTNQLIREL
jgi:hypothetical protein